MNLNASNNLLIDHINHNGLDNRKCNLRIVNFTQNQQNKSSQKNSSSKYLGVAWYKRHKKWIARIKINKKLKHLGYFLNEKDAAKKYNEAALEYFKEFANLNIID